MTGFEKLLQRKLPADVFKAVSEALDLETLDFVPRARLNEVIEERDEARADLRKLQAAPKDNSSEELQKQLQELQSKYDTDIAAKNLEIRNIKVSSALTKAKARNAKAVLALMDDEKLGDDLKGLDEEIQRIRKSDAYLFEEETQVGTGASSVDARNSAGAGKEGDVAQEMYAAVFGGIY